jgi:hypothetical protein
MRIVILYTDMCQGFILWHIDKMLGNDHEISDNSRYYVMALQTTAVARQWLSSDHVVTPTDRNTTIALQQRNGVFYLVQAEML